MTRAVWIALAVLCAWAFIAMVRRIAEQQQSEQLPDGKLRSGYQDAEDGAQSLQDSIDWETLQKAEDEVRDIDPQARPEDGFEGDDWGPGSAPKPPLA